MAIMHCNTVSCMHAMYAEHSEAKLKAPRRCNRALNDLEEEASDVPLLPSSSEPELPYPARPKRSAMLSPCASKWRSRQDRAKVYPTLASFAQKFQHDLGL